MPPPLQPASPLVDAPVGAASPASADVAVYRHPDEFPADVEALFALGEAVSCELGSGWYRNYLKTVAKPADELFFHVLRRRGQAIAVLPIGVKRGRFGRQVEALGNYYTAFYAPVLHPEVDAAAFAVLLADVKRRHAPMASMRLQPMDPQAPGFRVLVEAARAAGLLPFEFHCFGNWYLRNHVDWPTYLAQRTSKMRSNIKRMDKKLAQDGGTVEIYSEPVDGRRAVDAFQKVYSASWKNDEPYPHFMPGLIATCAERGWMRLGVVWLRGQPIAAQLWMVSHRKADIYKVAYDETFKDYSPGTVLTARLMQHVIERDGVEEVDYLIGDDGYKKLWMSDRRTRSGVVIYNPRTVMGALGALREIVGRALKPALQRLKAMRSTPNEAGADATP
ncbi:MAG TPA: GNAT family N-acetyltransferase [Albitalea sp.]|uniref:GNAT family N-acetyltransferase n=1 Tax=Piscinibacter sp. TaxID=1903157 RepID=UPI002ED6B2B5